MTSHFKSSRFPLASRQKQCNRLSRFVLLANREDCNHYWKSNKSACDSPKEAPKKYREQDDEWRHGQSSACNPGFKIAPDNELNEIQANEHGKTNLPLSRLDERKKCRKYRSDKRTEKRNVIQNKGDHAPGGCQFDAGNQCEAPHYDAGQEAHCGPHDHVFLKFLRDLLRARQK